jgi:hypothetical protein
LAEILAKSDNETNLNAKHQRIIRYPEMEFAMVKWFWANQERANVSGELVRESATKILDRLYPGHEPFEFSSGWLEAFKSRHGIRSYRRFGESGFVDMVALANTLLAIRDILDQYAWKDIYNMDEIGLSIGCRYCKFRFVYCKCLNMI